MRTRHLVSAAIAGLLTGASPTLAHMRPMTGEEMVHASRYVVVATVLDRTVARTGAAGLIVTRYRLAVEEGLRGDPPKSLTVEVIGGTLDGETQTSCLTVHLALGGRYALFVNDPERPGFSAFTGAQEGVVQEVLGAGGRTTALAAGGGPVSELAGKAVSFGEFVDRLRAFVVKAEASPAPQEQPAVVHDPPLPAKRYVALGQADLGFDPTPLLPVEASQSPTPVPPAHPDIVELDASHGTAVSPAERPLDYSSSHVPSRYIVWNQLPSSATPWSPRDQAMMSRWNTHGDVHRVSGTPTGTWSWGNGVYDIAGFVPSPTMFFVFGRFWAANELAICFSRWFDNGPIVESDITINPAFIWTVDNELGTRESAVEWGFDQTILHELGHSWGLAHPWEVQNVWWDSVMNYSPKRYRLPNLFGDDVLAIRLAYPGASLHDGLVSFYYTEDNPNSTNAWYTDVDPNSHTVTQGATFSLDGPFKVENVGTDSLVNPRVDVYLNHHRMSWSAYEYVQSLSFALTVPAYQRFTLTPGAISIPFSFPPGQYYMALWLYDAADSQPFNNEAWQDDEFGPITILSYPWSIYPAAGWQYQQVRTGPSGEYDFYFTAEAGERVELSTCGADGGFADYDTIEALDDPAHTQVAFSDDACGLQSRISYFVPVAGQHHVHLRGYQGAFGTARMQYRSRSWADAVNLTMSAQRGTGLVHLSWTGESAPYDVERSTTPYFSNPTVLWNGLTGNSGDDTGLANGVTYYYRVR